MAISVRSPKGRFGGLFRGGSSSSSSSSGSSSGPSTSGSGSNQGPSSQSGGSRYPLPDPGAFGSSDNDDSGTSSGGGTSYTGGGSSRNSTSSGASKDGSMESSNAVGGVNVSTGTIIGLVAGAVGFIFLMSCVHYWSREIRRSFEKNSRFRYENVLWKSVQVITGIRFVKWFVDKCRDPTKEEERDEVEEGKPQDGHSNRPTPPYATFGFVNGEYQIIHYPRYELSKKSDPGEAVYTSYVPVSPAPTLSPGRRSMHGDWPEAEWQRVSVEPGDVGPRLEEASARVPAVQDSGTRPGLS